MADNEDGTEKTEEPTGKRLEESREKGQIPRSKDLNTFVMLMMSAVGFLTLGGEMVRQIMAGLAKGLQPGRHYFYDTTAMMGLFVDLFMNGIWLMVPFVAVMAIAALASPIMMGGWAFSTQAMAFKISKLNPAKGIANMFSIKTLVELFKSIAKFVLVMSVATGLLSSQIGLFLGLGAEPVNQAILHAGNAMAWFYLILAFTMIAVVAIDVPFQLWNHNQQMKMTLQEVKDEAKNSEGRPEVKQQIRRRQQEIAMNRMMQDVPDADVVVTNPTHFAVALKYDQENMGAPRIVAKGADLIALQIRTVAQKHDVVMISAPPLARALYFSAEIGQEIPQGLYMAIAQLLAHVYQLDGVVADMEDRVLKDLPIPEEYQMDAEGNPEVNSAEQMV
ncbi:MAG: flagellar biosynthesis protein FlhB [Gammaproteobacteria bacterium]|jgi:flagellar biosynthetic protein FlhB|nr:flagellar biosynthesis protein FlhB [Gammaproteobacteria bacterium]MBT3489888.1 flagellar biosynthesis protein FlhB [Gammaproteobacteria bacterium]MBT3719253.1 flagellar biosynthesis protein FlhB [Gammaproteobacteria bacterium]MBT3846047.1 flagellar biosynthesis protein FlhB [Gammaproteobacteria bacterium]MBT3893533.1 flagellar biosynthesis protein FlhB [Gammaproteobacteria bacterium]